MTLRDLIRDDYTDKRAAVRFDRKSRHCRIVMSAPGFRAATNSSAGRGHAALRPPSSRAITDTALLWTRPGARAKRPSGRNDSRQPRRLAEFMSEGQEKNQDDGRCTAAGRTGTLGLMDFQRLAKVKLDLAESSDLL